LRQAHRLMLGKVKGGLVDTGQSGEPGKGLGHWRGKGEMPPSGIGQANRAAILRRARALAGRCAGQRNGAQAAIGSTDHQMTRQTVTADRQRHTLAEG
jgi:hypothetical protein